MALITSGSQDLIDALNRRKADLNKQIDRDQEWCAAPYSALHPPETLETLETADKLEAFCQSADLLETPAKVERRVQQHGEKEEGAAA